MQKKTSLFIVFVLYFTYLCAQEPPFEIRATNLVTGITSEGIISLKAVSTGKFNWPVNIFNTLEGCETIGDVTSVRLPGKGIEYKRLLKNKATGRSCTLTERFKPGKELNAKRGKPKGKKKK